MLCSLEVYGVLLMEGILMLVRCLCHMAGSAAVVGISATLLFTGLMLRRLNIGIANVSSEIWDSSYRHRPSVCIEAKILGNLYNTSILKMNQCL